MASLKRQLNSKKLQAVSPPRSFILGVFIGSFIFRFMQMLSDFIAGVVLIRDAKIKELEQDIFELNKFNPLTKDSVYEGVSMLEDSEKISYEHFKETSSVCFLCKSPKNLTLKHLPFELKSIICEDTIKHILTPCTDTDLVSDV